MLEGIHGHVPLYQGKLLGHCFPHCTHFLQALFFDYPCPLDFLGVIENQPTLEKAKYKCDLKRRKVPLA